VFDSLNYVDNLKFGIDSVRAANGVAEATLCYTGDVSDPSRTKVNVCMCACVFVFVHMENCVEEVALSYTGDVSDPSRTKIL